MALCAPQSGNFSPVAIISGPDVTVEDETPTVVSRLFDASIDAYGYIELTRRRV